MKKPTIPQKVLTQMLMLPQPHLVGVKDNKTIWLEQLQCESVETGLELRLVTCYRMQSVCVHAVRRNHRKIINFVTGHQLNLLQTC